MRIGQTSVVAFLSQFLSSAIGFAATFLIARNLGDDVLGVYALVIAVVVWLKILGGLGVREALRKRLSERGPDGQYFTVSVLLQAGLIVLLALVLYSVRGPLSSYLRGTSVWVVILLSVSALAFAFVTTALEGQDRVHVASTLYPVDRSVRSGIQIGVVLLGGGLTGLFFGYAVGAVVASVIGLWYLSVTFARPAKEHVDSIVSYAQFSWLTNLSNRAFASMDTLVLGLFVAEGLIGVYEVSWNLASILALFGVSIRRAVFPSISHSTSEGAREEAGELLGDALTFSGLLLIPGFVGSLLVGDLVLGIYGGEFRKGYLVLVVLIGARTVYAYKDQFVNALNAIDEPAVAFRVDLVFTVLNVGLNLVLVWLYGWIGAAVATFASAGVAFAISYVAVGRTLPFEFPTGELGRQVGAALGMGAVVGGGRLALPPTPLVGVVLVLAGGAAYFLLLLGLSATFRRTVERNLPT